MTDAPLRLDVYPTDAEAFEAAAALAAERLRAAVGGGRRATIALSGGRGGRGVMVALAGRGDVSWDRVEWFWGDERCVAADDPRSNVRLARESLLTPRGVADARIHPPPVERGDPEAVAAAYAATLTAELGALAAFDVVLLGVGRNTHIASLMPGCRALAATTPVAAVAPDEVSEEPLVPRITVTPPVLRAARQVIVVVAGPEKAEPVARVLRAPDDPTRIPAQLVRPSPTVTWCLDLAAAQELLRDAVARE